MVSDTRDSTIRLQEPRIVCPNCRQEFAVDPQDAGRWAGEEFTCTRCSTRFIARVSWPKATVIASPSASGEDRTPASSTRHRRKTRLIFWVTFGLCFTTLVVPTLLCRFYPAAGFALGLLPRPFPRSWWEFPLEFTTFYPFAMPCMRMALGYPYVMVLIVPAMIADLMFWSFIAAATISRLYRAVYRVAYAEQSEGT